METQKAENIRMEVLDNYGKIARGEGRRLNMCEGDGGCCSHGKNLQSNTTVTQLGYTQEQMAQAPQGANMGLGCGNPLSLAGLKIGETVLDLGSGGGFDCFLAARAVGNTGHVIGVDMTPDMVSRARIAAEREKIGNVEFRLGEIERLPVADESVDVILSNCVINLSPQKHKVFEEAFRVLKKGGRLAVSDVVAVSSLPAEVRDNLALISSCIGGAEEINTLQEMLAEVGFEHIAIEIVAGSQSIIADWFPGKGFEGAVASAHISALKPSLKKGRQPQQGNRKQVKKKVHAHYLAGFHCAEVITHAILENFISTEHSQAIKAASGFGGGIAGSMEGLCGAYTGAIIAIGVLLGRETPGDDLRECAVLINEYNKRFLNTFGSLQCQEVLKGVGDNSQMGCVKLTAEAAMIVYDLLDEWQCYKGVQLHDSAALRRDTIALGSCPFSQGKSSARDGIGKPGRATLP